MDVSRPKAYARSCLKNTEASKYQEYESEQLDIQEQLGVWSSSGCTLKAQ